MRVAMGVIGIIYEARPNVTVDAAALCFKAGSACVLRGGKEAFHSSMCLTQIMRDALAAEGLPVDAINLVEDTSRESANQMMKLNGYLDVLIPRGGAGLIQAVVQDATVPVIETGTGNCHVYVDASADLDMAARISAKRQVPAHFGVQCRRKPAGTQGCCRKVPPHGGPGAGARSCDGCTAVRAPRKFWAAVSSRRPRRIMAANIWPMRFRSRWSTVWTRPSTHINRYNTGHSECIVTENYAASQRFLDEVDAAAVYVNASTRFTDGFEFGLAPKSAFPRRSFTRAAPWGWRR